jgi:hypothetical protein
MLAPLAHPPGPAIVGLSWPPKMPRTTSTAAHVVDTHTFRKIRLRYIIHTGTKQTAVKLTE